MAAVTRGISEDVRRATLSPRSKGRENAKDTLCRNVTIYGHCRYEDKGCAFNHDPVKAPAISVQTDSLKKRLNVDSPSFTPASTSSLAVNGTATKSSGLSPKAASAAPFMPKGLSLKAEMGELAKKQYNPTAPDWALGPSAEVPEFLPQPQSHNVTPSLPSPSRKFKTGAKWAKQQAKRNAQEERIRREKRLAVKELDVQGGPPVPPHQELSNNSQGRQSSSSPKTHDTLRMDAKIFVPSQSRNHLNTLSASAKSFSPPAATPPPRHPFHRSHHSTPLRPTPQFYHGPSPLSLSSSPFHRKLAMAQFSQVNQNDQNGVLGQELYDPYVSPPNPLTVASNGSNQPQINPYSSDTNTSGGASYYHNSAYAQPVQYHLYTSLGPHREAVHPYQRPAYDFFIPDALREDLQRKSAATLQILPNSTLPPQIDHFHSLVPLDTTNQKNAALFGYPSWIYKAVSSKDGNTYALRRLEGYRLTNEKAIRSVQAWKRLNNGNIVTFIDAFTNRSFGDSSLMFVTDYHPLSKTLAETYFTPRYSNRSQNTIHVTEQVLWSYMIQIANALKAIHGLALAARVIDPSKVLLTSKNRIRLNACAILDVVQHDTPRPLIELQREDLLQFGRLILAIGTGSPTIVHNIPKAMEQFSRTYSPHFKNRVFWLLGMITADKTESIETFIAGLSSQILTSFDASLHLDDQLNSELNRELENSRIVRLMTKLNFITERPDYSLDRQWSETGERFPIKLFRDYVFHQVDAQGNPVLDLGHVLGCLNKLDAGVEEKIVLTSRDDQICIVVTFKEMKRAIESAWQDLVKASRRGLQ